MQLLWLSTAIKLNRRRTWGKVECTCMRRKHLLLFFFRNMEGRSCFCLVPMVWWCALYSTTNCRASKANHKQVIDSNTSSAESYSCLFHVKVSFVSFATARNAFIHNTAVPVTFSLKCYSVSRWEIGSTDFLGYDHCSHSHMTTCRQCSLIFRG